VEYLLTEDVNVNFANHEATLLMIVLRRQYAPLSTIETMIEKGADVNQCVNGNGALSYLDRSDPILKAKVLMLIRHGLKLREV
jgi:hypothetical protein